MDEAQVRQIVQDELTKNYTSGTPKIPPHQHNSRDNLNVGLGNITGSDAVPYGSDKISDVLNVPQYGYASPLKLGSKQFVLNNYRFIPGLPVGIASLNQTFNAQLLQSTTPIPVIIGATGETFQGGYGSVGTMVAFVNYGDSIFQLWVRLATGWNGVALPLSHA